MNTNAQDSLASVSSAFHGASGPAKLKCPESGWWFEWEGMDIAKALLDLDPKDIQYEDIIHPIDGSFVPSWTTTDALLWLVPGMIRVCFEVDSQTGDQLYQDILTELHKRLAEDGLTFSVPQIESLLNVHEALYCTEAFDWRPDSHSHPLLEAQKSEHASGQA